MFRVDEIQKEPLHMIPCVNCAPGGRRVEYTHLPILQGHAPDLPDGVDAVIVASDLQAFDTDLVPPPERRLIGLELAEELELLCELGELPDASRVGVLLAGDLYAIPTLDKRGGLGDVERVWEAFAQRFAWVAGVAGNHDSFSGRADFEEILLPNNAHLLHGDVVELGGVKFAGISGIVGKSGKPWRVPRQRWSCLLQKVMYREPDVLILHQGPQIPEARLGGLDWINEQLEKFDHKPLVICGHEHWSTPLATTRGGHHVLNVDYRCVVLQSMATART